MTSGTSPTGRLLLIEDNRVVLTATAGLLTQAGHQVTTATSAEDGLRLLEEIRPDLVLMDVFLPGISGLEAVRRIKANPDLDAVMVVNLSARFTSPEDQSAGLDAGADGYIVRPVSGQELLARVNAFLRQKRTADALRDSRRQLANAQRIAQLGSWEIDIDANVLVWSEEVYRIFDRSPTEFTGTRESFLSFVHPDDRARLSEARARAIETGGIFEVEHRIVCRDGTTRHVFERAELVIGHNGRRLLSGTVQDITERREGEEKVRRLAERLSATVESITDAFFTVDRGWVFTYANSGAQRLMQRSRDELIGRRIWDVFPEEEGGPFEHEYRRALDENRTVTATLPYAPFGLLLEMRIYPSDEGLAVYFRDVTEARRTADRLKEQASLLDKAQDAIMVSDLDQHITYWNKGAERLYGWTSEQAIGRRSFDLLLSARDHAAMRTAAAHVMESGEWTGELRKRTRDGEEVIVEARFTLVRDDEGRPKSLLSIETGITERKRLEQQVLRAQRMESIGTLAGGIAHDLNNVLTPITLGVTMLKETITAEEDREILDIVQESAARGTDMVAHVLAFARGAEGRRVTIQPLQLLKDVERITRDTFPKSIEMRAIAEDDLWPVVGDSTQLHQVLLNLCLNARDAMPEGGQLTLHARNVEFDERTAARHLDAHQGRYVLLEVSDTGSGIHPGILERIFDPFFTTKAVGKGTGLGLSTSRTIVRSHGGFLEVQSDLGVGTTFRIHLPAGAEKSDAATKLTSVTFPRGNDELVLVIDDEAAVRQIAERMLTAFGYRVVSAPDGAAAVEIYRQRAGEIQVVITDMMMPNMDGPATIKALMQIDPTVPIIATSGIGTNEALARQSGDSVKAFLSKPYTVDSLLNTLRRVLA